MFLCYVGGMVLTAIALAVTNIVPDISDDVEQRYFAYGAWPITVIIIVAIYACRFTDGVVKFLSNAFRKK